ncbi:Hypothetical protein NCS54_00278900 [Fusarium falciforme]|uniref:Hypothetical protein n=1 Tax=Fusarium falciforme TaxID=195108 RepID=UPI002300BF2F|nr:Hypothetical protein NCS54_00278900 [Fusarium falciforme]WAO85545.1 Hypothetical protein NCS54_00278900 [Fusarium falciforme]
MRGGARCSASLRQLRLSRSLADGGRYARALRTSAAPQALRSLPYCRTQRPELAIQGASLSTSCPNRSRSMATVVDADPIVHDGGPIPEYDRRVEMGKLRNDEHQRGEDSDGTTARHWLTDKGPSKPAIGDIPNNLPRGLYLYGDVGCGKTMLMDLFYETLPASVKSKTRIHFNNFMQDVHKRLHRIKMEHGNDIDAVPYITAEIAQQGNVLCFDEFQLLESLMSHGVVLVTTSNRHPDELYKNGVQRESFIPAIDLLKNRLHVINLDSPTDYRKIPRPPSDVYHTSLDSHAHAHAEKWFRFLGDPEQPEPRPEIQKVWGREIYVPRVSGRAAWFTFDELIRQPKSAADYLELVRSYEAFIVTDIPGMTHQQRDLARRFITFIDVVYEGNAKLVLTTEKPLTELFVSRDEIAESLMKQGLKHDQAAEAAKNDLEHNVDNLKDSNLFAGSEEAFAFARALSRLRHMESKEWVERGMGLESQGGKQEQENWNKTRSRQMEDSM